MSEQVLNQADGRAPRRLRRSASNGVTIAVMIAPMLHGRYAVRHLEKVLEADDAARASDPTRRTASSTPGMNDSRSIESCRIVNV